MSKVIVSDDRISFSGKSTEKVTTHHLLSTISIFLKIAMQYSEKI